jgi:6-pyruvoyltetrahydropterin/6-carboxytetrahydropterin synthase
MSDIHNVITRKLEFDAGHRLVGHESQCAYLHGHRYAAEITVRSADLDSVGRVVDFGVIKKVIGGWIQENWDHNIILNSEDPLLKYLRIADTTAKNTIKNVQDPNRQHAVSNAIFNGRKPYVLDKLNPTVEVMAKILARVSRDLLLDLKCNLHVQSVRLYETPNCWADANPL